MKRVLHEMRLSDGVLFPLPITLTADPKELPTVGDELVLRNANNEVMAVMTLDEVYHWDAETEAALAYGSTDEKHPMVSEMARWNKVCISGALRVLNLPRYHDFVDLRRTPVAGAGYPGEHGARQRRGVSDAESTASHS